MYFSGFLTVVPQIIRYSRTEFGSIFRLSNQHEASIIKNKRDSQKEARALEAQAGKILVFDSGLGGLSVLRQLRRLMPRENFLLFLATPPSPPTARARPSRSAS